VKGLASLRDLGYGLRIAGERVKQHRNEQKSVNQASFHAYLYNNIGRGTNGFTPAISVKS
jgi:hypothetical protein